MTPDETIDLLTMIATFDQRTVGEADVAAWHAIATETDWTWPLARRAVIEHHKRGGDRPRIKPGHITDAIDAARDLIRRQVFQRDLVPPKHLADDPRAELEWRRQHIADVVERGLAAWATGDQLPALPAAAPTSSDDLEKAEKQFEERLGRGNLAMPSDARSRRGQPAPNSADDVAARERARAELEQIRRNRGEAS
jgi:hypothetical protein